MKLYIPTSSLNLDNILQAESISPLLFYAQRKTGYDSLELIEEVKQFQNHIVLFDHPVSFSIHDPGRYNFPLLIEIEVNCKSYGIVNVDENGMYLCGQTLPITPWNSSLLFFRETEYKMTIINTKDNKSIKYYKNYNISPNTTSLSLNLKPLNVSEIKSNEVVIAISQETKKDKQKGTLYGYLLGQRSSLSPQLAHLVKLTQDLYNVLTSVISAPQIPDILVEQAEKLYGEYKNMDPIEKRNRKKFDDNFSSDCEKFKNDKEGFKLQLRGLWHSVKSFFCKEWHCEFLPEISLIKTKEEYVTLRAKIKLHTSLAVSEYRNKQSQPSLNGVSIENGSLFIKNKPYINKAINFIIEQRVTSLTLCANRLNICSDLVNEIKEIVCLQKDENYWKQSKERGYFTDLYNQIKKGDSFDLNSIENEELIAIAAFLLKGEGYDNLKMYLQMNEQSDQHLVFALWGTLCGYMEMNRDNLIDVLSKENYISIDKCLFNTTYAKLQYSVIQQDEKDNTFQKPLKNNNSVTELGKEIQDVLDDHPRIKIPKADIKLIEQLTSTVNGDKKMFIQRLSEHISKTKNGIFPHLKNRLYPDFTITTKKKDTKSPKEIQQIEMNFANTEKSFPT